PGPDPDGSRPLDRQVHGAPGDRAPRSQEPTGEDIMTDRNAPTTLVYRVYIKATPDQVWQAITDPEWTNRYGYTGYAEFDLRPGGRYRVIPNPEFKRQAEEFSGQSLDVVTEDRKSVVVGKECRTRWSTGD